MHTHFAAYVDDLAEAMRHGYPYAFNNMSIAYDEGDGVEEDKNKAGDYALETFNRIIACCATAVSVELLKQAAKYDPGAVRRVANELLLRAAALGVAEAHTELASLYESGTLAPLPDAEITSKFAAYEHRLVAKKLAARPSGQSDAIDDRAAPPSEGLTPEEIASVRIRVDAWKPEGFDALPPWLKSASGDEKQARGASR